jgi:hypothetical protein
MADTAKAVINLNLAAGLEAAERVTVAFLVGGTAVERGGQLGGATPLWEWIGDDGATVFSY